MIHIFLKTNKFLPYDYKKTIYDIDFNKLYDEGKKVILTDLDNTLISYKENLADDKLKSFINELKNKFEIIIVSNNRKKRVSNFSNDLNLEYVYSARKPRRKGIKKGFKKLNNNYNKSEVIFIGDQLMTDVYGANRFKLDVILVDAISKKTEKWYTKINRRIEKKMMKKIYKKRKLEYDRLKLGEKI